jgi:para-nitrobenzyl esterase
MQASFRNLACAAILAGAVPIAGLAQAPARPEPVKATIDAGVIVGESANAVTYFRGIPYAQPPIGELRWRPPAKPTPWSYERKAVQYSPPCPQVTNPDLVTANGGGVFHSPSEDCLYLNVTAPQGATKAPVLVWLYGGASRLGAGNLGGYDGTSNARNGVVTVTINYRLGPLGSFAHPALAMDARPGEGGAAFALMDAVAALEWVRRNAAAFGGDAGNVTIAGQSAGAGMVTALLSIPAAKGLYHKAIIESGAMLRPAMPLAEAEQSGAERIAKGFGLPATASAAQLRAIDASSLVNTPETANSMGAIVDGRFITGSTHEALKAGIEIDVPVLVGANSGEGGFDAARTLATLAGDSGAGAWLYRFTYRPAWRTEWTMGPVHSAELMFTFDSIHSSSWAHGPNGAADDRDLAVARKINSCWIAFMKMDPAARSFACAEGFTWPAYTASSDQAAELGETPRLVKGSEQPDAPPGYTPPNLAR